MLQAYLYRTEATAATLRTRGSQIRFCRGRTRNRRPSPTDPKEIDLAYVRCLKTLMSGSGYPMVATHDPRLVEIALALAEREQRTKDTFELQMLYGIRPAEQERLAGLGHTMRLYVPYGTDWYGYLVRRLAEKPANCRSSRTASCPALDGPTRDADVHSPATSSLFAKPERRFRHLRSSLIAHRSSARRCRFPLVGLRLTTS